MPTALFVSTRRAARSRADELYAYYADRALLVQPFLSAIVTEGEFSLFYFNGLLSHTILKLPKPADFRVQEEHGGIIRAVEADDALREAGDAAMRAIETVPLYARADFVRANDDSSLRDWRGEELSTVNQQLSTSSGSFDTQPTTLNCSDYWLMEMELIEPSLYLRTDKGAPGRFARALHERVLLVNEVPKA